MPDYDERMRFNEAGDDWDAQASWEAAVEAAAKTAAPGIVVSADKIAKIRQMAGG